MKESEDGTRLVNYQNGDETHSTTIPAKPRGVDMKILHVLANGPPDVNGYTVRTHGLMKAYSELPNIGLWD